MRLKSRLIICTLLMLVTVSFFACDLAELPDISCTGTIIFNEEGLSGVEIKSNVKSYCFTDTSGNFSFETKAKTVTIIPQLEGYFFEPESITLTEGENEANFVAIKVYELNGEIVLNQVVITPTTINSYGDNYLYKDEGKDAIRARELSLSFANESYNLLSEDVFLYKDEENVFDVSDEIKIVCGSRKNLGFLINAYFNNYYTEWYTTGTTYTYLSISNNQTNADLKDGKIIYTLYGINNETRSFTYNISFIFSFVENAGE